MPVKSKDKKPKTKTVWQKFVAYMRKKKPGTPLKELLKGYDRKEYEAFKKDPKKFIGD